MHNLHLSDQQMRDLLNAAPDATIIADQNGIIISVNTQAEALFGYSRDELRGKPVECLLPERLRASHPAHRNAYVGTPRVRPMGSGLDLYARRRDGSEFPVEISLSPFRTEEGLLVSTSIRDVTAHKVVLEQLKETRNEAEKANRAKSVFLATASHDLRQPLQTLMLLNSVLEKTSTDPRALTAVETQREALTSMSELINALLDISKLESGAVKPDIRDCSVQAIFRHLKASFEHQAQAKGLSLLVGEADAVVHSDSSLLEQVIQNLVANAIRYTQAGAVELRCLDEDTFVRIDVLDSGIGIPAHQKDLIFEEFYQLNRTAGKKQEGLGLGLAIVRRIAQLLECSIEVDSSPGRGSRFSVKVPRGVGIPIDHPANQAAILDHAPAALIMLVDDDPAVATATRMLLELEGHEVFSASNTRDSMSVLNTEKRIPDLIVSDFHLGGEDTGIQAIGEIRQLAGWSVPAVLVTGDTSRYMVDAVELSGNCEILSKPVAPLEFLERVNWLLQKSASRPQAH